MEKCFLVTSYIEDDYIPIALNGYVIAVDGGYDILKKLNINIDIVVADLDSTTSEITKDTNIKLYHSDKDDTDTILAIEYAINNGYKDLTIIGGLGRRLDHTLANIQTLAYFLKSNPDININIIDKYNIVRIISNESITLSNNYKYLSLISLSDKCFIEKTTGLKWNLNNHTLTNSYPLGVSNVLIEKEAMIKVQDGLLIVIQSKD